MPTSKDYPGFAFYANRMVRMWRSEIDRRLAIYGLTESRWLTLFYLKKLGGEAIQAELADAVGVKGPTMVKTLDWLEAERFIERCSIPADRRTKIIKFSDKATDKFNEILQVVTSLRHELLADFEDTEIETSLKVIHAISQKLNSLHSPDWQEK